VITTEGLTKRYGKTLAVEELTFQVAEGQICGFLGSNGSGKTTTIGMLMGVIRPTRGTFRLLGRDGERGLLEARRQIGATLESPNFYPHLSGRDNLRIVANVKGVASAQVADVVHTVGLDGRERDRFETYSLGMKQRLALASTLLGDPSLLILDEPTNGLDPEGTQDIREIILSLNARGKTILLSSHLLSEVQRICTHVAIVKKGHLIRHGTVAQVTAGKFVAELRSADWERLLEAVRGFPGLVSATAEGGTVAAELVDADLRALNAFLAGRGVTLSHLALRQRSLEAVFMELSVASDPGAGR